MIQVNWMLHQLLLVHLWAVWELVLARSVCSMETSVGWGFSMVAPPRTNIPASRLCGIACPRVMDHFMSLPLSSVSQPSKPAHIRGESQSSTLSESRIKECEALSRSCHPACHTEDGSLLNFLYFNSTSFCLESQCLLK